MGSFKRAAGMEDDDVDSNLFFDRVYCANPQVCDRRGLGLSMRVVRPTFASRLDAYAESISVGNAMSPEAHLLALVWRQYKSQFGVIWVPVSGRLGYSRS